MIEILDKGSFDEVWEIMQDSFPLTEHRTYENQKKLLDNEYYTIYVIKQYEKISGFITLWEFQNFTFIEHFAVSKNSRNNGLGKVFLDSVKRLRENVPIYLEVEPPENDITLRRVEFYKRNGFVMNEYTFLQPALIKGQPEIPLKIMTYPEKVDNIQYDKYYKTVITEVYKNEL